MGFQQRLISNLNIVAEMALEEASIRHAVLPALVARSERFPSEWNFR